MDETERQKKIVCPCAESSYCRQNQMETIAGNVVTKIFVTTTSPNTLV